MTMKIVPGPCLAPEGAGGGHEEAAASGDAEERIAAAETLAAQAVARYREMVAQTPGLVPEMVQGCTIEEIDAAAQAAREAYSAISRRIGEQLEREVPTGNPARSANTPGLESLRPEAKIALGLRKC